MTKTAMSRSGHNFRESIPLLLVILAGIYDLPATIIGIPAPNLIALLLTIWALAKFNFPAHTMLLSVVWIACASLSDWFSPSHINTIALSKTIAQCTWSIYLYGVSQSYIERAQPKNIYKICTVLLCGILAVGSFELIKPISDIVVDVSTNIYKGDSGFVFQYDDAAQERDAALAGKRRSTMFMAEPSLAGIAIATLVTIRALTGKSVSYIQTFAFTGLGLFLTRSPFCLLGLLFVPLINCHKNPGLSTRKLLLPVFAIIIIGTPLFAARLAFFTFREDYLTSEALRFMIPIVVFAGTMANGHLLGLGPSGFSDDDTILNVTGGLLDTPGTNALFAFLTTLGPLVAFFFTYLMVRLNPAHRHLEKLSKIMQVAFLTLISVTVGSFVAPKIWILFGIFSGCLRITRGQHHALQPKSTPLFKKGADTHA